MNRLLSAFFNSIRGLEWALRNEASVRTEMIGLCAAVPLAAFIADDMITFIALTGAVLLLLAVELLNTGLEKLSDHITPEHHPQIGIVKDLGSAAVFVMLMLNLTLWSWALWQWWGP